MTTRWLRAAFAGLFIQVAAAGRASGEPPGASEPAAQREPPPGAPVEHQTLEARLQGIADAWVKKSGAPGMTLAVAWPDGRLVSIVAGLARKEPATPMRPGDRMMSGSIGKMWCAAIALQLVDEGRLELDAPISRWLGERPWFDRLPNARTITLRMLLNHTSGIPEHVVSDPFTKALKQDPWRAWTPEELITFTLDVPAHFEAGRGWSYADTNYVIVGAIIESVTGRPYNEELRRRLLQPLALDGTTPSDSPSLPGLVCGYTGKGDPFLPADSATVENDRFVLNPQFEYTGGGLVTTTPDLARWVCAVFAGEVIPEELREEMRRGVPARTGPGDQYGLGVQIVRSPHGEAFGHSGFFPGYVSCVLYFPDLGLSVAWQTNTSDFARAAGHRALLFEVAGAAAEEASSIPIPEARPPLGPTPDAREPR